MEEYWTTGTKPLEVICLDTIKEVLSEPSSVINNSRFIDLIFHLPSPVVDSIFQYIERHGDVTDAHLKIFHGTSRTHTEKLELVNIGDSITAEGLFAFSTYELKEVTLHFDQNCTTLPGLDDLWKSFQGSEKSLRVLKIFLYPAAFAPEEHVFDLVMKFPNLETLTLHTSSEENYFNDERWRTLLSSCSKLKSLEIFCPKNKSELSINSLLFTEYGQNLISISFPSFLNLKWAPISFYEIHGFAKLGSLTCIDLSIENDPEGPAPLSMQSQRTYLSDFVVALTDVNKLQNIASLDLSGWKILSNADVENILEYHQRLQFLGLCLLDLECTQGASEVSKLKQLQISGVHLESQIMVSLMIYPHRVIYIREALKSLFVLCGEWTERRPDVIKLVLQALRLHPNDHLLQLAGTACLYNLSKNDAKMKPVPTSQLIEAGELALKSLKSFLSREKRQIIKNCLLIFCNDRLLHHPKFQRYVISRVCLDCMLTVPESLDRHITRMAVAIVSVLACKITSTETSALSGVEEMKLLLKIAVERVEESRIDGTLKFDLSALWNLTDESPKACHLFVQHNGLKLYTDLLRIFPEDHTIQTKVLGLLNNIAEVSELHDAMVTDDLMQYVRTLIQSDEKSVSYFAGGIIANLLYGWNPHYHLQVTSKEELSQNLENAVASWGNLDCEIVTYRSFKPFLGLLESHDLPAVQHFSLWAIHHVCTLNSDRYAELMTDECTNRLKALWKRLHFTLPKHTHYIEEIFKACKICRFGNNQEKGLR